MAMSVYRGALSRPTHATIGRCLRNLTRGPTANHRPGFAAGQVLQEKPHTVATKIRLKKLGKIREPHYRVIVIDSRAKRDGREIEVVGQYHPKNDPSVIKIDSDRVQHWLSVGAQPTEAVVALLKRTGDWQKFTGDTSIPSGVAEQAAKPNKLDLFNAALAEADGEPTSSAISKKGAKDEADKPAKADAAEKPAKDEAADKPAKEAKDEAAEKPADDAEAKA